MDDADEDEALPSRPERVVFWHRRVLRAKDDGAGTAAWTRTVVGRCLAGGAELALQVSGTVVSTFDPDDLFDVVEIALDLALEAEDAGLAVAIAVTIGETEDGDRTAGPPFERAELLAFRAHAGEVALDQSARTRARGQFLFARQLAGTGAKGFVVDRNHPRRDASGDAMAKLGAVVVPTATAALLPLVADVLGRPRQTVVLRGPPGAGAHELSSRVAAEASPPRQLVVIGSAPGTVVPLASLSTALDDWPGGPPETPTLAAVRGGEVPPRAAVAEALAAELSRTPTIVLFAPISEVDAATLEVVLAARELSPETTLIARLGVEAGVPGALSRSGELLELTLPILRTGDAREVARGLFGPETDDDLVRRVAVVGGDSALGVLEAARTFVSCGDLVVRDGAFVWRGAPRGGATATALEVLVAERFEMLDDESRRLLEAAAVLGEGASASAILAIAKADGLGPRAAQRALSHLGEGAWLETRGEPPTIRFSSAYVRRFVVHALPPARRAEVHRFAIESASEETLRARVARGWHVLEGGREDEGGAMLLASAQTLAEGGWPLAAAYVASIARRGLSDRAALGEAERLSQPLAELAEPSVEIEIPSELDSPSSLLDARELRAEPEPEATPDLVGEVRAAIRARDPEALEKIAQRATLEGSDMNAVARLRALADLLRGDVGSAARGLVRARSRTNGTDLRALVAEAMVALRAGTVPMAIRFALRALLQARRTNDTRGEAVALFTLAACYRALGREADAGRLEARAHG